jgi:CBS-domain-containing membrane protein
MIQHPPEDPSNPTPQAGDLAEPGEIRLSDVDILDAMREIPGYLDITTSDFRALYHLAHHHALDRLFQGMSARRLVRAGIRPLAPETPLVEAIPSFVDQGLKTLPVVDPSGRVLGVLTETDVLRELGAISVLDLLQHLLTEPDLLGPGHLRRPVSALMTTPAVGVPVDAGFRQILAAFAQHAGRAMPVLTDDGRLVGLLLRKDFITACHLEGGEP